MERKTVLITGASGGIGSATARLFAQKGYGLILHYHRGAEQARALAEELGGLAVQGDLSDEGQVEAMVAELGRVDVLVCCGGIAQQKLFTQTTGEDWDKLLAVNVKGTALPIRALLPQMIARQAGSIVTLSSMWGEVGASCEVAYSATKGAIIAMTKALAKELGPSGIRVNCVSPGLIQTPMNASLSPEDLEAMKEETPLGILGTPEDVAQAIYFLASQEASFFTGQVLSPNGGMVV